MGSYNSNVPASDQTLAETQSPIQNNFATIATDFGLDHYTFAATNEGYHKQITLPSTTYTAAPTTPSTATSSILYPAVVTPQTLAQLYFLNNSGTAYQLTNLLTSATSGNLTNVSSVVVGTYIAFTSPWGFKFFMGVESTAASGKRINRMASSTFGSTIYCSLLSPYGGDDIASSWTPTVSGNFGTVDTTNSTATRWLVITN
mgnify:CR=1 FL=1